MKFNTETYRSFLLGKLGESESEELEGRFLEDPEIFDQIEAIEAELIDEWVRGELPPDEKRRVDRLRMTSPRVAERIRTASALAHHLDPLKASPMVARRRLRTWLMAASLTGLALLSWATSSIFVADDQPKTQVAEVVLYGDALRSGSEAERVVLEAADEYLVIKIDLGSGAPFPAYEITVRGPQGATIWAPSPLKAERLSWGLALVAEIPGDLLEAGHHQVELMGLRGADRELLAFYGLEVIREPEPR